MGETVYVLLGPTASGKTALSLELFALLDVEIVVCDSMQVYRELEVGTGKPSIEVRQKVPHHLLDIRSVEESFSVGEFVELAEKAVKEILAAGKRPLLVVGTPMYAKCFLEGLDHLPPESQEVRQKWHQMARERGTLYLSHCLAQVDPVSAYRIQPNDLRRLVRALEVYELTGKPLSEQQRSHNSSYRSEYDFRIVGIMWPREELYRRIDRRVWTMFDAGWWEEAERLAKKKLSRQALQALGYKEIFEAMRTGMAFEKLVREIQKRTRHFARRQILWFRKFPHVHWLELQGEVSWKDVALKVKEHWEQTERLG